MSDHSFERIEAVVRAEIAAHADDPAPATPTDRLRSIDRWDRTSGTPALRRLRWLQRKARRVLFEIRRLRTG